MADQSTIAVELSFSNLPEGWRGTPQQFAQWLSENAIFKATGAFLTGQIGGARPVTDVGVYVNGNTIELWQGGSEGKYVPLLAVPVGTVYDWPSGLLTPPSNHLFCDGQSLAVADYPELFAVLGTLYKRTTDLTDTFRLPDYRGRYSVGAGDAQGEQNPRRDAGVPIGNLALRSPGQYFGSEWPAIRVPTPPGAATPRYSLNVAGSGPNFYFNQATFNTVTPPSIVARKIIRVR